MSNNDDKYKKILEDIEGNREYLKEKLNDLEKLREDALKTLLGDEKKKDFRDKKSYSRFEMEEYLKIVSHFYSTELNIVKQLDVSAQRSFDIMRKLSGEEKDIRTITADDIKFLSDKIEELDGKIDPKDAFSFVDDTGDDE